MSHLKSILGDQFQIIDLKAFRNLDAASIISSGNAFFTVILTSYRTLTSRCKEKLAGAQFGIGLFDEAHTVRNKNTEQFRTLMGLDCPYRVQLTGTPIFHGMQDWIVMTQWLQVQVKTVEMLDKHGARAMQLAYDASRNGDAAEAYHALRDAVRLWTIRRWGDTTLPNEKPLVELPPLIIREVKLKFTKDELSQLQKKVHDRYQETTEKLRFCDALYTWRLESFQRGLQESQFLPVQGNSTAPRRSWDDVDLVPGPILRWLEDVFLPKFLERGTPEKIPRAVIFGFLPGQSSLLFWVSLSL